MNNQSSAWQVLGPLCAGPLTRSLTTLVEEGPSLTGHALKATMVGTHNHSVVPFEAVSGAHRHRNL